MASIKARLAKYKFNTEFRIQSVYNIVNEFKNKESLNDCEKYVLNLTLNTMKDEYKLYEDFWYENHYEFAAAEDFDDLADELYAVEKSVDKLENQALELSYKNANSAAVVETESLFSSKIDDTMNPDEGQDDHENATKVLEMFEGIVNPDLYEQISELETKGRKRGGEVDEPLQNVPKQIVSLFEVGCDPLKHTTVKGGNLITKSSHGWPPTAKASEDPSIGLRTLDNSLDDPMEPDRFTQHRWKQYHRWPPPF